ncbi:MAG: hypothetical protein CFK52_12960 [Chloracidobacterium sp. CP2_5A]|nr:MAG: hypothetical protein CFK52_12960 [Chloracidobacterium sp. CP2_5A]
MLFFLFAFTLLGAISYAAGVSVGYLFRALPLGYRLGDYWLAATWLGLLTLGNALLALSLLVPLTPLNGALLALVLCLPALTIGKRRLRWPALRQALWKRKSWLMAGGLIAVAVGAFLNRPSFVVDAGAYHIGSVEWLSRHGAVPGLALLNCTLGYGSAWFALVAPLNAGAFAGRAYNAANGFVYLLLGLQIVLAGSRAWRRAAQPADWFLLTTSVLMWLLATRFMGAILPSPSPDIPVALGLPTVAWAFFLSENAEGATRGDLPEPRLAAQLMALGLSGVKLNALPAAALCGLFLIAASRRASCLARATLGGVLLLAPSLATRVVMSGYPFFPARALGLGLPWEYASDRPEFTSAGIRAFAQWSGKPAPDGPDYPLRWLPHWIAHEPLAAGLMFLQLGALAWAWRRWRRWTPAMRWAFALAGLGALYVMAAAPALRFLLGYAVIALGVLLTDAAGQLAQRWRRSLPAVCQDGYARFSVAAPAGLLAAAILTLSLVSSNTERLIRQAIAAGRVTDGPDHAPGWLRPPRVRRIEYVAGDLPRDTTVARRRINDVEVVEPHAMCWDLPLPCSPPYHKTGFRLRDPQRGVAGGFIRGPNKP